VVGWGHAVSIQAPGVQFNEETLRSAVTCA
jgi:hypothetical protein